MTHNCTIGGEENAVEAPRTDASRELDELRLEIAELRASRMRLLLAADAERRSIERVMHDGLQQLLVGLAADVELASRSIETDPKRAMRHLAEVRRDLGQALEAARTLAHRIHPALEAGDLGVALRSAAADAGVRTTIDVVVGPSIPSEIAVAVYFSCLEVLRSAAATASTVTARERDGGVTFEIVADGKIEGTGSALRDRAEALGGTLTIRSEPGPRTVWTGFLPLER
jgi:signal transduction histidine kinase